MKKMENKVIVQIKNKITDFSNKVLFQKSFFLPVILFSLIAYGYDLFNDSVSMDDMAFSVFGGETHMAISIMRWGIYLISPIINTSEYSPYVNRFLALLLLVLAGILLSFIIWMVNGKKNEGVFKYAMLTSFFISYPLINEIWECTAMSVNIYYNGISYYFCLSFLAVAYQFIENKYSISSVLISGLLLTPVVAGYESVMFAYITVVLIVVYYNNLNNKYTNKLDWIVDGFRYAIPLMIALVLRVVVGNLLIMLVGVEKMSSLGRTFWSQNGFVESVKQVIYNGWYYVIRALTYYPVTEFLVCLLVYVAFVIKDAKKKPLSLLLGLFVVASLFFLSVVQGDYLYYRQAQTVQLFVAVVIYMILDRVTSVNSKRMATVVGIALFLVCIKQSIYLHQMLTLNHLRSENESFVAKTIGYKIYSEFDKDKLVIFCGEYQLGSFIQDQITVDENSVGGKIERAIRNRLNHIEPRLYNEYVYNNVNSYFNKQMDAFNGQIMIKKYMSYYGFDLNVLENLSDKEEDKLKGYYEKIAKENNMKPYEIKDMGDYILVYLGPTIDGVSKLKYK